MDVVLKGSKINMEMFAKGRHITLPRPKGSVLIRMLKYGAALIAMVSMCWLSVLYFEILTNVLSINAGSWVVCIAIVAFWTLTVLFVVPQIFKMLSPLKPQVLYLDEDRLVFDTGSYPYNVYSDSYKPWSDSLKLIRNERAIFEWPKDAIKTMMLSTTDFGEQLTIGQKDDRIAIGSIVSDTEKVWLYKMMMRFYSIEKA
ncbi:MAG: hypothetical protein CMK59_03290 [Proteobacteria bacterium]|nr:hypothetical protein [Pseudomonadota bacterium]